LAITVARGVLSRLRENSDSIALQVRGAADPKASEEALKPAGDEIFAFHEGPNMVTEVLPTPQGPFIFIDGGASPYAALRTIPDILAKHLRQAGVSDAVIAAPRADYKIDIELLEPNAGQLSSASFRPLLPWKAPGCRAPKSQTPG